MWEKVYFLVERGSGDFKIGISRKVFNRIEDLNQDIDSKSSLEIKCKRGMSGYVEACLQTTFDFYRFEHPGGGSGRTEWFRAACFKGAIEYVHKYQTQLRCFAPEPLSESFVRINALLYTESRTISKKIRARAMESYIKEQEQEIRKRINDLCRAKVRPISS